MSVSDFIKKAEKRVAKSKEVAEVDIESDFVDYAKKQKCKALKLVILGIRGFPDRTVLCPGGRVFFIEFKKKNKTQSGPQKTWQRILESFGFKYHLCDEKGQAEKILWRFIRE